MRLICWLLGHKYPEPKGDAAMARLLHYRCARCGRDV